MARRWDFFLSYKSENANEVRRIAERLMAQGYRVWFAEYEVLLRNYEAFERHIATGAGNCEYALLFTTDDYALSEHCANEVMLLKRNFAGREGRIIEVALDDPNRARDLLGLSAGSPRLIARLRPSASDGTDEDERLLNELAMLTGLNLARGVACPALAAPSSPRFRARCAPLSLDSGPFEIEQHGMSAFDQTDEVSFASPDRNIPLSFNIRFHYDPQRTLRYALSTRTGPVDDRTIYRELREYAKWIMAVMFLMKERGLHLVWLNGRTQMALTHSFLWVRMRKYAVVVNVPRPLQVIITFGMRGNWEEFYRLAPLMDRVIESIRVEADERNVMGFLDKLRSGSSAEWAWIEIAAVGPGEYPGAVEHAAEQVAVARGKEVGLTIMLTDAGKPLIDKTASEVQAIARRHIVASKARFERADQQAIDRGDVCVVAMQMGPNVWGACAVTLR
jgi:hypothetical protein